ncbi:uncharacterized protein LOC143374899 [Andrena cerasifolii]|uniref:uncharacterized protein LOC143374899 n=1 Tax=Andrena cerasifolii TaxID=2819439 RepID=UPI004037FAE6
MYNAIEQTDDSEDLRCTPSTREPTIYTCSDCKYESKRHFNVMRHWKRIHWEQKLRICCGSQFFSKGDYYIHCEQLHPETRSYANISRNKYKITSDTIAIPDGAVTTRPRYNKREASSCLKTKENLIINQRFSERIRVRQQRQVKSIVSIKYSVTCSDIDMEDVPLISFLTDRRLKTYIKRFSPATLVNKTSDVTKGKPNETVKIAISSKENIEKAASDNGAENVGAKVSNSSVSSFTELPAKKLLLHRFRTSVKREIEIPLREQNNNIYGQVNFAQHQTEEMIVPVLQNRSTYSQRSIRANKENVPKFAFSLEQHLDIKLDRGITVPRVTQLHRDFLASIDFDQYKIF